jgi:hypothetical protein
MSSKNANVNANVNAKKNTRSAIDDTAKMFFSTDNITDLWSNTILPTIHEEFRLLPDSLLIGSAILALVTQSFSMTVFFATLVETAGLNALLQTLFGFLDKNRLLPSLNEAKCKSGFMSPTLATFTTLKAADIKSAFPSPSIFFLSTAASYIISSLYTLKDELEQLGPDYSARYYMAIFASFLFLLTMTSYRLYNGCDSVGPATLSLLAGGIVGSLLVMQNLLLLGKDSINMIGVPLLRVRTSDKNPIYVCPQKVSS